MVKKILKKLLPGRAEQLKETHFNRAIRATNAQTYLEIGIRDGACFVQIHAPFKIGVDPAPAGFGDDLKPGEHFFKVTSDAFFSDHAAKILNGQLIDVAFVDGLHEFQQSLRDILNLEPLMTENGVIFCHDFNPPTREHAGEQRGNAWNGDVWKSAYYIRNHRQDLEFFTLDCDWGVGVIRGFKPGRGLDTPAPALLQEIKGLDYDVLDKNRQAILDLRDPKVSRAIFNKNH